MGLNLRHLLRPAPVTLEELAGERVAIDAYGLFYQYLTMLRDSDGRVLTDDHGNTVSHLVGLVARTEELVSRRITPVYVLDGPPHPLKRETLEKRMALKRAASGRLEEARAQGDLDMIRRSAAATASVSREDAQNAEALLEACGVPVLRAPSDAEAQCAALAIAGTVHAAASQDYDTLVYGSPRVVRNLTNTRDLEELLLAAFLIEHGLDREALVDLACLVGNDFFPGVRGIGGKTALRLLARHGSLQAVIDRAEKRVSPDGHAERRVHEAAPRLTDGILDEVRRVFLDPPALEDPDVHLRAPDAAKIHERLVEVHGMSRQRADRFAVTLVDHYEKRQNTGSRRPERPLPVTT